MTMAVAPRARRGPGEADRALRHFHECSAEVREWLVYAQALHEAAGNTPQSLTKISTLFGDLASLCHVADLVHDICLDRVRVRRRGVQEPARPASLDEFLCSVLNLATIYNDVASSGEDGEAGEEAEEAEEVKETAKAGAEADRRVSRKRRLPASPKNSP